MRILFTMNVTRVVDPIGEHIETEKGHYDLAIELFRRDASLGEHELVDDEGRCIYYEMEEIDEFCVACDAFPCVCT